MQRFESVDDYLNSNPNATEALRELRQILISTELEEAVKWGAPAYTVNGKLTVGLAAFKNYIGLWFHQGVFLKDPAKVLINAQKGVTKGLRQWRFAPGDAVDRTLVLQYVEEAIANAKAGKQITPGKKPLTIPTELEEAFKSDPALRSAFEEFSLSKKREFTEHIGDAKREETRLKRLDKIRPMILEGIGLNDKYRK